MYSYWNLMSHTRHRFLLKACASWVKWSNYFLFIWMAVLKINIKHCFVKSFYYVNSCHSVEISYSNFNTFIFQLLLFPRASIYTHIMMLLANLFCSGHLQLVQSSTKNQIRQDWLYFEVRSLPTRIPYTLLKCWKALLFTTTNFQLWSSPAEKPWSCYWNQETFWF